MAHENTVSLCIIARDEAEHIRSCVDSARHLVDEVVVVDTGSTDQTAGLAAAAGARVLSFPWTGNFALARNFALDQAASAWILFLDADEVLEPVTRDDLAGLLGAGGSEGYFLTIISYLEQGQAVASDRVVRLFRNRPLYRFQGAIHEQVAPSIRQNNGGRGLAISPLVIRHYGYLESRVRQKGKTQRNIAIIEGELARNPGDPFLLYCLALELYQQQDFQGGLRCLQKALSSLRGGEGYFEDVLQKTAVGMLRLRQWETLLDFTGRALVMLPGQAWMLLLRGLAYHHTGQYLAAARDLELALKQGDGDGLPTAHLLSWLGDAYNLAGHFARAEAAYLAALGQSGGYLYPLTQLFGLVQQGRHTLTPGRLSQKISFKGKTAAWQQLLQAGETELALTVMLLCIHELAGGAGPDNDLAGMVELSQEFARILPRVRPLAKSEAAFDYLSVAAAEIYTRARAMAGGYYLNPLPPPELPGLVEQAILLMIKEFCPRWSP